MPAQDHYHQTVTLALRKIGWQTMPEQFSLKLGIRRVWIDIEAYQGNQTILVEVKGFENMASPIDYLEDAIGQYGLYRSMMIFLEIPFTLYMAIPQQAYQGIWSELVGQAVLQHLGIRLLVFSPTTEDIEQWL